MILYTGEAMHDPDREAGCWGDRDGAECGDPPVNLGLCGDCLARLGGERPTMPIPAAQTGCGRR